MNELKEIIDIVGATSDTKSFWLFLAQKFLNFQFLFQKVDKLARLY